jgi:ribosomal protein L7/L12
MNTEAAESHEGVSMRPGNSKLPDTGEIPPEVLAAISAGDKMQAIRLVREHTGLGLGPAKRIVDALEKRQSSTTQGSMPELTEVGGSRGLVVIVIACVVAWLLYQWLVAGSA